MKITEFCIRRPVTTAMFFTALMVLGFFSVTKMPMDLFPQITYPSINIFTNYSGAGPEEVERLITIPIERSVATVNKIKSITSTSEEGSSRVRVNFAWGVSLEEATNDIRANLDRVKHRLPDGAGTPTIFKFDSSAMPVMTLGVSGKMDEWALRKIAEDDLSYQLQRIEGVAGADLRGGVVQEVRVLLKQDRLQAFGITADQAANAIQKENTMLPAGYLQIGSGDFLLRTQGEFKDIKEFENVVVANRNGTPIYVRDLAVVELGSETSRSLVRIDGNPGVVISIQKQSDANTVAVADRIYKALGQLRAEYPELNLRVMNDSSTYIRNSVNSVSNAAIIGGILAALVLLLFLHNFRATVIVSVVMPISILATLILAYFGKMTLNTVSLGGLALGVGMLVDNSVVVLDNIFRHHQRGNSDVSSAALEGTSEMGPALSASTLTTICVFFPLIYISGRTGIIFKELSYMVIFSLLCSLVVAITLIPTLCSKFLKVRDLEETETSNIWGRLIKSQHQLEEIYQSALEWCLNHKIMVVIVCSMVFLATLLIYPLIGTELIQNSDEGVISVNLELPTGTKLEETDLNTKRLEKLISEQVPEVDHTETTVGMRDTNRTRITLRLKERRQRNTRDVVNLLQEKLQIPGARVRVYAQSSMRMLYGGSQSPISIDIRGYDQDLARQIAVLVQDKISEIPGVYNVALSREEARPQLTININRQRAADYGLSTNTIAAAIQSNVDGRIATVFRKDGQETNVRVVLEESSRQSLQDLEKILVMGSSNRVIPLAGLINVVQDSGKTSIERVDQERNINVSASIEGRDLSSVMRDIQSKLANVKLPFGMSLHYTGDYEEQQQSFKEIVFALTLALLLVYMVMASQFESFLDPLLIMTSVPFALGGVILMLLLTDTNFNTQVYTGLIMLGGVVVNNAIVLISYYRILLEQGLSLSEAVIRGSRARLRPILMTSVTTILGLIPLAIGLGEGSETQTPLARTVIGGLTFSAILTLFIIPVIFVGTENMLCRFKQKRRFNHASFVILLFLVLTIGGVIQVQAAEPFKISVTDAINLALKNSEDGRIIRNHRELAESTYREAKGNKKLNVYSELESTNEDGTNNSTLSLNAEKSIPLKNIVGLKSYSDKINEANRKIQLYSTDYQEQQFIYQVAVLFQQVWLGKRELQLAEENHRRSVRFNEEIKIRSNLGLTSLSDEIGAEAQEASASTELNHAKQVYRLAQLKLSQLLSLDQEVELIESTVTNNQLKQTLADYISIAQQNRTDLRGKQESVAQYEALLKLAKLSKQFGISLGWTLEKDNWQTELSINNQDKKTGDTGEWQLSGNTGIFQSEPESAPVDNLSDNGKITLLFKWTFLDGKVRNEKIKQAEIELNIADDEMQKLKKTINSEVEEAYFNYLYQQDKLHSSELQAKYNQAYLDAAQAKLRQGLVSVKDVLDAQVKMHQSALDLEKVKSDYFLAGLNLQKTVGELTPEKVK